MTGRGLIWRDALDLVREYWRRSAGYRFYLALVTIGAGMVSWPVGKILVAILASIPGITVPETESMAWLGWAEPLVGGGLMITGVVLGVRHLRAAPPPRPPDSYTVRFPAQLTFRQAVETVARGENAVVHFEGFSKDQLAVTVPAVELQTRDALEAIERLGALVQGFPGYTVKRIPGVYRVTAEGG